MDEEVDILHVNSRTSEEIHPENRPHDFTVHLPRSLTLDPLGEYYLGVRQVYLGFTLSYPVYLCISICNSTIAGDELLPVLRVLHKKQSQYFNECLYVPIRVRDVSEIRVYFLRTLDYKPPSYTSPRIERARVQVATHVTLEIRRGLPARLSR